MNNQNVHKISLFFITKKMVEQVPFVSRVGLVNAQNTIDPNELSEQPNIAPY